MTLLTYAVDLDQLRSTCGSGDLNLLDEARRRFPHRFEPETGSPDDGQEETGRASSERALTSLLTGEQSAVWGDDLAAALMVVCEILGERLPGEMYDRHGPSFLPEVGWIAPLLRRGPPIPLPPLVEIEIGHLTSAEAASERERLAALGRSHPHPHVVEARNELLDWLEEADRSGLGLVIFSE